MSLRRAILGFGGLLLFGAVLVGVTSGRPAPAIPLAVLGILLLLGTVFERVRYRAIEKRPLEPEWQRTAERFRDPLTKEAIEVFFQSGDRRTPICPQQSTLSWPKSG